MENKQKGFASITSSTGKKTTLYVGTHSETRAYLNTTSKELIPYLIKKYNLTNEDVRGLFSPDSTEERLNKHKYMGSIKLPKVDNGHWLCVMDTSLDGIDDIPINIENGVFVSLFCSESSVSVIGDLANKFGGVINENNHKCKYHLVVPTE